MNKQARFHVGQRVQLPTGRYALIEGFKEDGKRVDLKYCDCPPYVDDSVNCVRLPVELVREAK